MDIDLDARTVRMSVGEFADFTLGPRDAGEGPAGLWRAQLGTHWHQQLRLQAADEFGTVQFEVPIEGRLAAGSWTVILSGRIDQIVRAGDRTFVREVKSVSRALPEGEEPLRRDYPAYFVQLAAYLALCVGERPEGRLVFIETATGLTQSVASGPEDDRLLSGQLARVSEFLELRWRARERLRGLSYRPPFASLRAGQEGVAAALAEASRLGKPAVLLEAPTGFGKTGVLLEFALGELKSGRFERALYLSGKATGQLQVVRTLEAMAPPAGRGGPAAWTVRPKAEHCVNEAFHCVREDCRFLDGVEERWNGSGLARFYLFDDQPRDLASLRAAGLDVRICPYEITRAALPFNDLWIGDYNYVFAPGSRGLFYRQPSFEPGRSLLIVDEAHNLPARVADAYSHVFPSFEAEEAGVLLAAAHPRGELREVWNEWADFLGALRPSAALGADAEAEARRLISRLGAAIRETSVDYAALSPRATEVIWAMATLDSELGAASMSPPGEALPRLWWCRQAGELRLTCLDAAAAIGESLRAFGGVVLATATPGPAADFAAACGLNSPGTEEPALLSSPHLGQGRLGELSKTQTRRLARTIGTGADLLRRAQAREAPLAPVIARTPWREGAYRVAFDLRADTTFQHRSRHARTTALTVEWLVRTASSPVAVFFPSYAYAEMIQAEAAVQAPGLRVALPPRGIDLAAQAAWIEAALGEAQALFLVLGSGFSESIDLLGGRVGTGMVVGPALPEVNAVQRARLDALAASLGRDAAVRRTYRIPGMQKVNQALGRLVRAPGQKARVVLHCRRFAEPAFRDLLAAEYREGKTVETDEDLEDWSAEPIGGT